MYNEIQSHINNLSTALETEEENKLKYTLHNKLHKISNNHYTLDEVEELIFTDDDTDYYDNLDDDDIENIREIQHMYKYLAD